MNSDMFRLKAADFAKGLITAALAMTVLITTYVLFTLGFFLLFKLPHIIRELLKTAALPK